MDRNNEKGTGDDKCVYLEVRGEKIIEAVSLYRETSFPPVKFLFPPTGKQNEAILASTNNTK